jgi:hypothetical protein
MNADCKSFQCSSRMEATRSFLTLSLEDMKQPQCCVAVSCQASGISGYCTNSEKPCYDDSYEMPYV